MRIYHDPLPRIDRKDRVEAKKYFVLAGFPESEAENIAWLLSLTIQQRAALLKSEAADAKYLGVAI